MSMVSEIALLATMERIEKYLAHLCAVADELASLAADAPHEPPPVDLGEPSEDLGF